MYNYCSNNPLRYIDPEGRIAETVPLPEVITEIRELSIELQTIAPQLTIASCVALGIVLIAQGVNYVQNKNLAKALGIIYSAAESVAAGAPPPLTPDDPDSKGTQTSSKTLYNKNGTHIDVENPGYRPGQIHVQQGNAKYLYDVGKKAFVDKAGDLAPKAIQKLLEAPKVIKAIAKGLKILGY